MAEAVENAKSGLQRQAERIADKTDQYRRQIIQQTRFAIEQRTQISLAHANRVKQIALSLVTLIHTLQFHCPSHCRPLLNLIAEAQAMQKKLEENTDRAALQQKLLAMNAHRDTYEKSISSFWCALFTNGRQLQNQREINENLQTQLTQLVIPICGFDDKNKAITPDTVKKLKITSDQLAIHQGNLVQEQDKINQIENIFST